jgi:hypothetical protein
MLIICPEHGLFSQLPGNHLRHGCGKCAAAVSARKKTINADEILSHFVRIHGDQYDYTRVNYVKNSIKVEILCPIHGSFHVTPQHHKRGVGCNKCTGRGLSDKERIEYWETIHGLKYDYSLVEYEGDASPVKIICEEHGIFEQLPTHHRQGVGCPSCAGREFNVLYIWTDKHGNHKIGVTKSIKGERRIYDCAKKRETTAFNIRLIRVENAIKHEQLIHKTFTKIPYTKGDGWTEFRKLSDEEYSEIQEYFNAIEGTSEF